MTVAAKGGKKAKTVLQELIERTKKQANEADITKTEKPSKQVFSDEGKKDILKEDIVDELTSKGVSLEESLNKAKRLVDSGVSEEHVMKTGVGERLRNLAYDPNKVDADFGTKMRPGFKAGVVGAGAIPATYALWSDKDDAAIQKDTEETKDKKTEKAEADIKKAEEAVKDERKSLDQSIDILMKGANPTVDYPTIGAYKPFEFERTDFSESLADDLKIIGTKYETELDEVEDKEEAGKDRAAMKQIFKGLIDAAAILYLAKHAPTATYEGQTKDAEYQRELDRLENSMAVQRGLVQDKFKELRAQTKARYATSERLEDKAEQTAYRDHTGRQRHAEEVAQAKREMFKAHQKAAGERRGMALKELIKKRDRLDKADAEGSKPDLTTDRQKKAKVFTAEQANKAQFTQMFKNEEGVTLDEFKSRLLDMGATDQEVKIAIGSEKDGILSSADMESIYSRLPKGYSATLAERQVDRIYGQQSTPSQTPRTLSDSDQAALKWAQANPGPKADAMIRQLKKKYQ